MTAPHLTPIPHTSFFLPKYSKTGQVQKKEEETQTNKKRTREKKKNKWNKVKPKVSNPFLENLDVGVPLKPWHYHALK